MSDIDGAGSELTLAEDVESFWVADRRTASPSMLHHDPMAVAMESSASRELGGGRDINPASSASQASTSGRLQPSASDDGSALGAAGLRVDAGKEASSSGELS